MGQKVSPIGFRVGVNRDWSSTWYADKKTFAKYLLEDNTIRSYIKKNYYTCSISSITLERTDKKLIVNIATARPGMIIGNKGAGIEEMKKQISKLTEAKQIIINIREVKKPDCDATLMAEAIAIQLEKRVGWRRAMKQVLQKAVKTGVKGVKIMVSGRLDGAEIARSEYYMEGSLPLHTLKANIDYGVATAHTTFGAVGIKVWINKGDIYGKINRTAKREEGGNN